MPSDVPGRAKCIQGVDAKKVAGPNALVVGSDLDPALAKRKRVVGHGVHHAPAGRVGGVPHSCRRVAPLPGALGRLLAPLRLPVVRFDVFSEDRVAGPWRPPRSAYLQVTVRLFCLNVVQVDRGSDRHWSRRDAWPPPIYAAHYEEERP
jgi:hypothetical protein